MKSRISADHGLFQIHVHHIPDKEATVIGHQVESLPDNGPEIVETGEGLYNTVYNNNIKGFAGEFPDMVGGSAGECDIGYALVPHFFAVAIDDDLWTGRCRDSI